MLLNLLPGLRDLRAPLATGALWLATLWVLFRSQVDPTQSEDGSLLSDVSELADRAGAGASIAALTFASYLVGIVMTRSSPPRFVDRAFASRDSSRYGLDSDVTNLPRAVRIRVWVLRLFRHFGQDGSSAGPYEIAWEQIEQLHGHHRGIDPIATVERSDLPESIRRQITQTADHFPERMGFEAPDDGLYRDASVVSTAIADGLSGELPALANRLQIEREAIFDRYDRMLAESEFRLTSALPLGALIVAVSRELSTPWPLLALAFPAAIFVLGIRRYYAARALIWEAVTQRLIQSTILTTLESLVSKTLATQDYGEPSKKSRTELRVSRSARVTRRLPSCLHRALRWRFSRSIPKHR